MTRPRAGRSAARRYAWSLVEERADDAREVLRPVDGHGVRGRGHLDKAAVAQHLEHLLGCLLREDVALGPAHDERRAGDPAERLPQIDDVAAALAHHVTEALVVLPGERAVWRPLERVPDPVAELVEVGERVRAADVLERPLFRRDPLRGLRHDVAHPLEPRED